MTATDQNQTRQATELDAQRMEALQLANNVRRGRQTVKQNIKALSYRDGRTTVAAMLEYPSGFVPGIRVFDLLLSIRKVGQTQAKKWLRRVDAQIVDKRVSELTPRQRAALVALLREPVRPLPSSSTSDLETNDQAHGFSRAGGEANEFGQ